MINSWRRCVRGEPWVEKRAFDPRRRPIRRADGRPRHEANADPDTFATLRDDHLMTDSPQHATAAHSLTAAHNGAPAGRDRPAAAAWALKPTGSCPSARSDLREPSGWPGTHGLMTVGIVDRLTDTRVRITPPHRRR
jgi:hypothetical protein